MQTTAPVMHAAKAVTSVFFRLPLPSLCPLFPRPCKQWRSQDFKVKGTPRDVARKADAEVGLFGRGSAAGPLPIS